MPGIMQMPDLGNPDINTNRCFFMPMPINPNTPSGCVLPFAGKVVPNGWLLCDGSAVSRTEYKELFAVIGTDYGEGDGSTTFNVPNLNNTFIEGTTSNESVGTTKEAGLPNITGTTGYILKYNNTPTGAFTINTGTTGANGDGASGVNKFSTTSFDASKSNAIYGKSTTVQPPAVLMKYIIKI